MHLIDDRNGPLPFRLRGEVALVEPDRDRLEDDSEAAKQRRKEARRLADAARPLDAWERYRALVDAFEQGLDLAENGDRKVRFALVVMASLNIGLFVLATRPELLGIAELPARGWAGAGLLAYAAVAAYLPRTKRPPGSAFTRPLSCSAVSVAETLSAGRPEALISSKK